MTTEITDEWGNVLRVDKEAEVDPFDAGLDEIRELNHKKRGDYASDDSPWANFIDVGHQLGQPAGVSVEALIATKQSRLRHLLGSGREPNNESVRDSLIDRATYALIAVAMWDEGLYEAV